MRPVKIEFQAFGPYPGYEEVDFRALSSRGLFLICGKTGIGKTMILDAMTFALYGKSSGHGRDDFESMRCTNADFDRDTFVRFEFENRGEHYLFERRLERKRKNLSPSYNVSKKDEEGNWRPLMENAKDKAVNEKALELIGLEYEQFRQVIVLPQGQFERLLTSNSDEKERILTSIFGEEKWQAIAELFYNKAEERKNGLKRIKERMEQSLSEEECSSIEELELKVKCALQQKESLEKEFREAGYDRIIKEQQEMLAIARRFGDLHREEKKAAGYEEQEEERLDWERRINDSRRAGRLKSLIEAEENAFSALSVRKKEEDSALKRAGSKKRASEEASEKLRSHLEKSKDIDELKEKKIRYEGRRKDYEGLGEAEKELKSKNKAAADALAEEKEARKNLDALSEAIIELKTGYSALLTEHGELLNSYLSGITGELAGKLRDGEPCPVCGSREHPHRAMAKENRVSRADVDDKKKAADRKYKELQEKTSEQERASRLVSERHAAVERINTEAAALKAMLEGRKKNLVEGIDSVKELDRAIDKLKRAAETYEKEKEGLSEAEKKAKEAYTEARAGIDAAKKETAAAGKAYDSALKDVEEGLKEHGFSSREEVKKLMLSTAEEEKLLAGMADFDAGRKQTDEALKTLREELKDRDEPDEERCIELLDSANNAVGEYREKNAVLRKEIERLRKKADLLRSEGEGMEERIREAEEDFAFAKRLRGDSGTGLRRYVLGIMFSSVVSAANKMLEMVHGGRYRLYRSDEKVRGTNKRGLELKVFDKYSAGHEGRFVGTLSGGEKFLASLALSIGMSAVARKSGINIEALFIDEGFGSLDDESIGDAMNVLNSIQEAKGLVGIISHVQILQDQIPTKLRVEEDSKGSRIVCTVG